MRDPKEPAQRNSRGSEPGRERRHRRVVAGGLEQLEQIVQRVLIEGRDHRLGDVGEEVIDAEARAGERIDPIAFQQTADDEPEQELTRSPA